MSDPRHVDYQRLRTWGDCPLVFAKVTTGANYDVLFQVDEDFYANEFKDEAEGRMTFEFRCYTYEDVDKDTWKAADLVLFDGRRMELPSPPELKRRTPAHYKVIAIPVGEIEES